MREQLWGLVVGAEELLAVRLLVERSGCATWALTQLLQLARASSRLHGIC